VTADEVRSDAPGAGVNADDANGGAYPGDGVLDARARLVRVGSLVSRPPVTCAASTSIREAAGLMVRERISSLLIPHAGGLGILTDRDLRSRVVAPGRDPETPIADVMTPRATTVPGWAMVGEAILAMLEGGFHHVPVTDRQGSVLGVVTDTDLIGLGRDSPFLLKRAIEDAPDAAGAIAVASELPRVVRSMVRAGVDPVDIGYAVALMTDSLTMRFVDLASKELGSAPVPWAWLALGSEARREQGLHSDQDHAIAYDSPGEQDVDPYFASLAATVTSNLEAAGIPRCRGEVMATERSLRRPLDQWVGAFRGWMSDLGSEGSVQASIVFDYRRVAGTLDAESRLDEVIREAPRHPGFATQLAHRALDLRPPLGVFHRLVTERGGPHGGTLDIKQQGLLIVTGIARALTVGRGIIERSTVGRLRSLRGDGGFDGSLAADVEDAFRFLWGVRLRHQVDEALHGADPDDHIDPRKLGPVTRPALRESFRVIERAQRALALELGLHPH
jgi:CBS domain-containing protein